MTTVGLSGAGVVGTGARPGSLGAAPRAGAAEGRGLRSAPGWRSGRRRPPRHPSLQALRPLLAAARPEGEPRRSPGVRRVPAVAAPWRPVVVRASTALCTTVPSRWGARAELEPRQWRGQEWGPAEARRQG